MRERVAIVIFARLPRAGRVKRRLIPALGPEGAACLQERMTREVVKTATTAGVGAVALWATPTVRAPFFEQLQSEFGLSLHRQSRGSLGERMLDAFRWALRAHPAALLVGSDCPSMEVADLREAARHLRGGCDVVLGPATDGGYFLIGLRRPVPELFRDLRWGSETVLETTRSRLRSLGLGWRELGERSDVDRPRDLDRLEPRFLQLER